MEGIGLSLRVRDVECRAVLAPMTRPLRTSSGAITQAPLLLIDLRTEQGITGRSYLFGYHAFTLKPLRDLVLAMAAMIKGDAARGRSCRSPGREKKHS